MRLKLSHHVRSVRFNRIFQRKQAQQIATQSQGDDARAFFGPFVDKRMLVRDGHSAFAKPGQRTKARDATFDGSLNTRAADFLDFADEN